MIKRIIVYVICLVLMNFMGLQKEIISYEETVDELEIFIKSSCLKYVEEENIMVVFDYDILSLYLDDNFKNIVIERISNTEFIIKKEIKIGVFLKEMKERFYIRRGDFYDGWN